jgi:hypothetical protein
MPQAIKSVGVSRYPATKDLLKANVGTCSSFAFSLYTSSFEHNNLQHSKLSELSCFSSYF